MKHLYLPILLIIGIWLAGCRSQAPAEAPATAPAPAINLPTPTPLPTSTLAPNLTATPEVEPTAEEVAAELSEPEPPQAEPNTPTSQSEIPTPTATSTSEETFIIPGNPDLDYAQVIYVRAAQNSDGSWKFDTTVRHDDQGWDDYAEAWYVVHLASGEVLGERILLHPHDTEQPFTRSQNGIIIPEDVTRVIVRAKDNVEGFGGQEIIVDLTVAQSDYFEVVR